MTRQTIRNLWRIADAIVVLGVLVLLGGCRSTVTGGTSQKSDERLTTTTGATTADARTITATATAATTHDSRDSVVRIEPDGTIEVRSGKAVATTQPATASTETRTAATTQPTHTESTRTEAATTQPSASSTSSLPNIKNKADGSSIVSFDVDTAAANVKTRGMIIGPFVLAAIGLLIFRQWLSAAACFVAALVAALVPPWMIPVVVIVAIAGVVAWLLWGHVRKDGQIGQLVKGAENAIRALPAEAAALVKGKMAEVHDDATKAVVRKVKGKS